MEPPFICANWNPDGIDCKKAGGYSCKNYRLVTYCGPNCQRLHWALHKIDCKSPLGKETWNPAWILENRQPTFMGDEIGVQFGRGKYLWGNIPALDILQLGLNEGDDYGEPLRLLFAASGDLGNVAKTIAQIPSSYNQAIDVTMNDRDLDTVARNAIMLLIALVVDNIDEAVDCMIHVWYSALVRKLDLDILQQRISPLIEKVCETIKRKAPSDRLGKTWKFGPRSLRIVLEKTSWDNLLLYVNIPGDLTAERANQVRTAVTLADSRKDYRDRQLLFQSPARRIAKNRFRSDGLLLPFGSQRDDFREPNPTFFQTADTWPIRDNADPLNGWSAKEVEDTSSGPATADIYGKLFYLLRAMLRAFLLRLSGLGVSFRLFQVDASDLPDYLETESFSRIEVSNISDAGYLGIHHTIGLMVPLLQVPHVNPYATLLTLFMNVVDENVTNKDKIADITTHSPTTKRLHKYLPPKRKPVGTYDPEIVKFLAARESVATYDHVFDRFVKDFKLLEAAQFIGAAIKEKHTVVEKWPFRLNLQPGQSGAQDEFDSLMGGGLSGKERYMEWKRTCIYSEQGSL